MLLDLKVKNFAIIENLHLSFGPGLNIISGETGAGKSVLLKGLGLLMGMKSSSDQIRSGSTQASIEGRFDLSKRPDVIRRLQELGMEVEDKTLIVRRVVSGDKSKVFLNDSLSTLQQLREVIAPLVEVAGQQAPLIEMTGQHDSRHLMSKSYHLDIVDQYGGIFEHRQKYSALFKEWKDTHDRIEELQQKTGTSQRELDYLKFQRDEIIAFDPNPGEDVTLEAEIKRLRGANRTMQFIEQTKLALDTDEDSALSRINKLLAKGSDLANLNPALEAPLKTLELAKTQVEEALFQLERSFSDLEDSEASLERLETRLSQLRKLQKKYGTSIDEILAKLLEIETEISVLANIEAELESLEAKAQELADQLATLAEDLHSRRVKTIKIFTQTVNDELLDLNMKGTRFSVHVEKRRNEQGDLTLNATGFTDIEFCIQAGTKDQPKPLAKYASGGELSRILLSIKRVGGMGQHPRTYLFDEVDTGVSGETAEKVGRKLRSIADGQQVICVTHLPQVAIFGNHHFLIQKNPVGGEIEMRVTDLSADLRIREIARLVSGEKVTDASLKHAQEMLASV